MSTCFRLHFVKELYSLLILDTYIPIPIQHITMSESTSPPKESTSPPLSSSPMSAIPRQLSTEGGNRKRTDSDSRWRTSSFSQPGRIVVIAVDLSPNAKNAFDCKYVCLLYGKYVGGTETGTFFIYTKCVSRRAFVA